MAFSGAIRRWVDRLLRNGLLGRLGGGVRLTSLALSRAIGGQVNRLLKKSLLGRLGGRRNSLLDGLGGRWMSEMGVNGKSQL